jgi:hypothetical protein
MSYGRYQGPGKKSHKSKPGKDKIKRLVDEFDVDPELAHKAVRRPVYIVELDGTVYCSEERPVEPSAALRDQFRNLTFGIVKSGKLRRRWMTVAHLIWGIGYAVRRLDVMKNP